MHTDAKDFNVGRLPARLGDEHWRQVQRSVWRVRPLDDAALAAAAALLARRERTGAWLGLAAFGVLTVGAGMGLAGAGTTWSIGLLGLSLLGFVGSAAAVRRLRRAEHLHARGADYRQLAALIDQ